MNDHKPKGDAGSEKPSHVGVCGHCPRCGSPIYGPQSLNVNETQAGPTIWYSCECRNRKAFEDTIRTT